MNSTSSVSSALQKSHCVYLVLVFATGVSMLAHAEKVTWSPDSVEQMNWSGTDVWTPHPPTSADATHVANKEGQSAFVTVDSSVGVSTLNLGQYTSTTGHVDVALGGSLSVSGTTAIGGSSSWGYGNGNSLLKVSGGVFSGTGQITVSTIGSRFPDGALPLDGDAGIEVSGGTFGSGAITLGNANAPLMRTRFVQSGGTASVAGKIDARGYMSRFALSGGTLSVTGVSTFSGGFEMAGGRFEANGLTFSNASAAEGYGAVLSGGMITNAATATTQITSGAFDMTGGILHQLNGVDGNLTVNAAVGGEAMMTLGGGEVTTGYFALGASNKEGGRNVYCQTGGTMKVNTYLQFRGKGATLHRVEISGGRFTLGINDSYGVPKIDAALSGLATFCIRGTPTVEFNRAFENATARLHMQYLIDRRGLSPLQLKSGTSGAAGTTLTANETVHPYGGFQLITNDCFALVDSYPSRNEITCDRMMKLPNEALWHTGYLHDSRVSWATKYIWGVTLTNAAEIANGYVSESGVPCGFFAIKDVKASKVSRAYARLKLVPQGANTLEGLIAGIRKGGYEAVAEAKDGCNVRIDLPIKELGEQATDRKLLFDFTSEDSAVAANEGVVTTNALVTCFRFETIRKNGLMMLLK